MTMVMMMMMKMMVVMVMVIDNGEKLWQAQSPLPSNITASDFSINSNLMKVILIVNTILIIMTVTILTITVIIIIAKHLKEVNNETNPGTVAYPSLPNSPEVIR